MRKGPGPRRSDNPDVARFDQWAASYDRSPMQRFFFGPVHRRILDLLDEQFGAQAEPHVILDVGCGTGRLLRAAADRWPNARLLGADPAEQMVAQARRTGSKAVFSVAAAESLPFSDKSADVVLTSMSFHHWADQEQGIREIARVLRPKGLFCLADHAFVPMRLLGESVRSRSEVRALVTRAGLVVQRQLSTLPFVLFTLAQKP